LSPDAILEFKIQRNSLAAGALPQTPLRELAALPKPLGWMSSNEIGRKGRRGRAENVRGRDENGIMFGEN